MVDRQPDEVPEPAVPVSEPVSEPVSGPALGPRWLLACMIVGAAVAVLLLGAAAGLLIGMRESSQNAAPAPDSVDVGFCQDMTVHHRQAATMAALARAQGSEPRIRGLAFDIETTQLEQIGRMQGWLSLWGRDRLPIGGHMAWMTGAGDGHDHAVPGLSPSAGSGPVDRMPGMATPQELDQLAKATGRQFDVLFLQLMLRHHQGGAGMLEYAAEHAEVGVVRNLARQMSISQDKETDYLAQLLAERGARPLPN
jgi:uncharacterized protein (DUF305 family)